MKKNFIYEDNKCTINESTVPIKYKLNYFISIELTMEKDKQETKIFEDIGNECLVIKCKASHKKYVQKFITNVSKL